MDFLSEAELMKRFSHHNIVQLMGVCTREEPVKCIMEFLLHGEKSKILSPTRMSWGSCIPWPVPLSNNAKENKFDTKPLSLLVDGSMCRWMDKRKDTVKTIYP